MDQKKTAAELDIEVVGSRQQVPLLDGSVTRYVNLDNAASTPILKPVQDGVNHFVEWYASIHRGAGFKSQLSTWSYEKSKELLISFFGALPDERVVIFGKNTTEAINKLANRYPFRNDDLVLTTQMEHHSNDLPWRRQTGLLRIDVDAEGRIDLEQLRTSFSRYAGRIRLVAIAGASNVTGIINPISEIAELAHHYGAEICVDAAQLAPHREIRMGKRGENDCIDYLAISAHKMYAPFGTGALVGWKDAFVEGDPDYSGGGTVQIVTEDEVYWREPPDKEEAGSPNVTGAVALAIAVQVLDKIGMGVVAEHEALLTDRFMTGLQSIPDIDIYGIADGRSRERLGVIPFNIKGLHHAKVASILGCEFGIGVRSGCFCAHPYVKSLMKLTETESDDLIDKIRQGRRVDLPGLVRVSFGIYNTEDDVELTLAALRRAAGGDYAGNYVLNSGRGEYWPEGFEPDYNDYFSFQ